MFWLNLLLLMLLVAGHTQLVVTLVNRTHAYRIPCSVLRHIRHVHDVLVPAFPIVVVWFLGISGPGLLTGGQWSNLPIPWAVYLSLCGFGTVGLLASTLRWLGHQPASAQMSNDSRYLDIAAQLGKPPVGTGPYQFMTRIPGNESFQLEINQKVLRLPRLPPQWNGLSILHLSDCHFTGTVDLSYFQTVIDVVRRHQADMVVFTGDLLDNPALGDWIRPTLGRLEAPLGCYFILGNHDWYLDPAAIRRLLTECGWTDVSSRTVNLEDRGGQLTIGGLELPWMGTYPDFDVEDDSSEATRSFQPERFRLLLSHTPDYWPWAKEHGVDLMLAGHNHGGQVVLPVIGPVYSPSRYGVRYASGTFRHGSTVLHVSRGLSGRHPLRWRCPPEVTKLELQSSWDG